MSQKARFLAENGFYVTTPAGNSMRPFIKGGEDVVTVVPYKREMRKYDAVLYMRKNGEHVIHRIVGKKAGLFLIRGDNCYYTERIPRESVIGLVDRVRRKDKEILVEGNKGYAFLVWCWCMLYPLRFAGNAAKRVGAKAIRGIFGRKTGNEKRAKHR